ncbi:hypothetical protein [Halosimplex marinum]|uniref:hypothetical protein n=1 Tax=Halosimplex marinum TaxID=3396620 RepID=UPI003F573ADF
MARMQNDDESRRRKQVKFRADESLVEDFDEAISVSRSEALRQMMEARIDQGDDLDVPDDDELAKAYRWLVSYTNRRGKATVRLGVAENRLSQKLGYDQTGVRSEILYPLQERGYIKTNHGPPGYQGDGWIKVREIRRNS